jgi:hypothetical protein
MCNCEIDIECDCDFFYTNYSQDIVTATREQDSDL